MQVLYCHACKFPIPLNRPRLTEGYWYATCGECLLDHQLEPVSTNVFLPLRFRIASVVPSVPYSGRLLRGVESVA